jgi:hypothetical protein
MRMTLSTCARSMAGFTSPFLMPDCPASTQYCNLPFFNGKFGCGLRGVQGWMQGFAVGCRGCGYFALAHASASLRLSYYKHMVDVRLGAGSKHKV